MIATSFIDKALAPFIQGVAWLLSLLYGYTHSYAVSIAIVTMAMMMALLPLTLKSTKSMLEMQKVQPLIKQIQQDFKNDVAGRNEAMMALYKEHKINPAGGCLPMLLQMPFFMTMWRVLFGLTRECGADGLNAGVACTPKTFIPKYLDQSSELYKSLAGKKQMLSLGLDLSEKAFRVIQDNVVRGLPYLALVIIVGLLSYYQQRQMTARQSASAVNPQQQMIMNLMPIFFGFISLTFASGLIIYFLVQNIFRIAQNAYITRKFYGDDASTGSDGSGGTQDSSEDPRKPSPKGPKGVIDTSETKISNRPKPTVNNAPEKSITPPKAKPTPSVKQKPAAQAPPGRPKPPVKNDGFRPSRPAPKKK
jgi:YidC/Oxa1 family membrane protein insertase